MPIHPKRRSNLFVGLLCAAGVCLGGYRLEGSEAKAQMIGFVPADDLDVKGVVKNPDFIHLFDEPSPWATGLARLDVLQFRVAYLMRAPDSELGQIQAFLSRHNLQISLGMPTLSVENCGGGVEGITSLKQVEANGARLEARNIAISYVEMDEPLYYGRDYTGPAACRLSLNDVARRLTDSIKVFRKYYPLVKFILVEPPQTLPGGAAELRDFLKAYQGQLHELPDSVRFDVHWERNWRSDLPPYIRLLRGLKLRYSVIYNATHWEHDDATWISQAKANIVAFERAMPEKPDDVLFVSWDPHPTAMTPETNPLTETGLLKWYVDRLPQRSH